MVNSGWIEVTFQFFITMKNGKYCLKKKKDSSGSLCSHQTHPGSYQTQSSAKSKWKTPGRPVIYAGCRNTQTSVRKRESAHWGCATRAWIHLKLWQGSLRGVVLKLATFISTRASFSEATSLMRGIFFYCFCFKNRPVRSSDVFNIFHKKHNHIFYTGEG